MPSERYCYECGASWQARPDKAIYIICPFCGTDHIGDPPKKKEEL